MVRQIEIEWVSLKIKITADLLEKENPELCNLLWNYLPYESMQLHALISGQHLYHYIPIIEAFFVEPKIEQSRAKSSDGTIFLSHLLHLSIKYGEVSEDLPASPIAQVIQEDIPKLKEAGKECWESTYKTKKLIKVRVTRKGEKLKEDNFEIRDYGSVKNKEAQNLIKAIHQEVKRIWLNPPQEILDIHNGKIRSKAGSYNQYFATMVFVNGEVRHLGYNALGGLIKSCQTSDISLETLKQITKNFLFIPTQFLGYCGLKTLWNLVKRTLEILELLETKKEYYSLISILALYINRLNGWSLHYFPWEHGEDYNF